MRASIRLAAIIPAYNEEATVASVAAVAHAHPSVAAVIVVDDGSTDRTLKQAEDAGATVIHHPAKQGKAQAMETGTAHAPDASHFLFLDADLVGFTGKHIDALLQPFHNEEAKLPVPASPGSLASCAMSIGIRDRGPLFTSLNARILPWISGERVVSRELWEAVESEFKRGFRIELALNATARRRHERVTAVILPGLSIRRKEQKVGFARGLSQRARMSAELVATAVKLMLH